MKIIVFGLGYVGLSNAILLAQKHEVVAIDVVKEKVELVNNKKAPIVDEKASYYLENKSLNLTASLDWKGACKDADLVIVATPTNYDEEQNYFDTTLVEVCIDNVRSINKEVLIVIKSTVPVGYIKSLEARGVKNVIFSPEFLREGKALEDNLYPSRIIVGEKSERAKQVAHLYKECAQREEIPILLTNSTEAEAIKLFANTYLAMRVAYFNELDTYATEMRLNTRDIIQGVGLDPRIGTHYNNPSFGYGGYCLPKDTKQLLANFKGIPQALIEAIVRANQVRKQWIVSQVLQQLPKKVGIYRLIMKANSDNFRSAAVFDIMDNLIAHGVEVVIYEPTLGSTEYLGYRVENRLDEFANSCDLILANRKTSEISDLNVQIMSQDVWGDE